MNEKYLTLAHRIRADLETLDKLWNHLAAAESPSGGSAEEALIAIGYRLHNLYTAAENVFLNIAKVFGNQVEDKSAWHAELLERMRLDLLPLRPAVIDHEAYDKLHELRRFRHLFRAAYGVELDPERLTLVLNKALALREIFPRQVEGFLDFLGSLDDEG